MRFWSLLWSNGCLFVVWFFLIKRFVIIIVKNFLTFVHSSSSFSCYSSNEIRSYSPLNLTCHVYMILCNCRLKLNCIMDIRDLSIHANWLKIKIGLLQDQMTIQLVFGILIMESKFININLIMIWQLYQQYESIKKQLGIYIYIYNKII